MKLHRCTALAFPFIKGLGKVGRLKEMNNKNLTEKNSRKKGFRPVKRKVIKKHTFFYYGFNNLVKFMIKMKNKFESIGFCAETIIMRRMYKDRLLITKKSFLT